LNQRINQLSLIRGNARAQHDFGQQIRRYKD
jgi:hypothetical protein